MDGEKKEQFELLYEKHCRALKLQVSYSVSFALNLIITNIL